MSDRLDRFFRVLVQEIRKNRPEYLESPFTVAEIYQNLVPYRTHRDAIGVEMNGDYEATLLQLLGGEGDYLMLDSEVARREIREELQSPNPNTGLFRDFAAADVRLTAAHGYVPDDESAVEPVEAEPEVPSIAVGIMDPVLDEEPAESSEAEGDDEQPRLFVVPYGADGDEADDDADALRMDPVDQAEAVIDDLAPDDVDSGEAPTNEATDSMEDEGVSENGACHWCREELPERDVLNFCPFCGSDLRLKPCGGCGEELEPGWRFCPSCGNESGG